MSDRDVDTRDGRLDAGQIREELDALLGDASSGHRRRFERGEITVELSDGTTVACDGRPGFLRLDGERFYSSAWS